MSRFVALIGTGLIFFTAWGLTALPPIQGFHLVAEDDCGAPGSQPHLVAGQSWTMTAAERTGLHVENPRLFTFNHGQRIVYRFGGLRDQARYQLHLTALNVVHPRRQSVAVDGRILITGMDLPLGLEVSKILEIPPELCRDGVVEVVFTGVGGSGALLSAIELRSDQPGLREPPGEWVRFQINALPPGGQLAIRASLKFHREPWTGNALHFLPDGSLALRAIPHEQTGFTPWYDLRKFPNYGGECAMTFALWPEGGSGVSQFSYYTNDSAILRTLDWAEPDALRISFRGFDTIRTFREHERENYLTALSQTSGRIFPLARPPLLFVNYWGHAAGPDAEYMVKTFRLLGFNSVSLARDAHHYEQAYGWGTHIGQYWPPLYFPGLWEIVDEQTAAVMYTNYYRTTMEQAKPDENLRSFQICDEPREQNFNNPALANRAFREWLTGHSLGSDHFSRARMEDIALRWDPGAEAADKRLYYWSRRYRNYATPKMFALAAAGISGTAPNPQVRSFVALSGHHLYMENRMPLDMFQLAQYPTLTPGISDWMTTGNWWWDSHQSVAFSVAPFNAGARRYNTRPGSTPVSFPMMHCVTPSLFRAYTQIANQCKLISYYAYGPSYEATEGYWSDSPWSHYVVQRINNQSALMDDILGPGLMRPARVAMLYAMSSEIWWPASSFADKRAAFLALSHEYYQPELVTEEQVVDGALAHYDALYVLDSFVSRAAQERIGHWVRQGGLLWSCSEALVRDEYNEKCDLLETLAGLKRTFAAPVSGPGLQFSALEPALKIESHAVPSEGRPAAIECRGARIRARYADGVPAWLDRSVDRGKVVYLGHRAGLDYSRRARKKGEFAVWPAEGRIPLVQPLREAAVPREMVLSEPLIMALPLSTTQGTVVVLYPMNDSEPVHVELRLREPRKPFSVEWTATSQDLVALPFGYDGTSVVVRLPKVPWQGTMLAIRRVAKPPDDRLAAMRAAAVRNLASRDWQEKSAGAWFAGFAPSWQMADQLAPLLKHEHWAVRRSAAESLGRLKHAPAANALLELVNTEKDSHVLADALWALARMKHPDVEKLCKRFDAINDPFINGELARVRAAFKE